MKNCELNFSGWFNRHNEKVEAQAIYNNPEIASTLWRKWFSPDGRVEVRVRPANHNPNSLVFPVSVWKDGKIMDWEFSVNRALKKAGEIMEELENKAPKRINPELVRIEGGKYHRYEVRVTVELGSGMTQQHTHRFKTEGEALCWIEHCC